jgi:hypothetical protein
MSRSGDIGFSSCDQRCCTDFDKLPVTLPVAHRLVYSPHACYFEGQNLFSFDQLKLTYTLTLSIFSRRS